MNDMSSVVFEESDTHPAKHRVNKISHEIRCRYDPGTDNNFMLDMLCAEKGPVKARLLQANLFDLPIQRLKELLVAEMT